MGLEPHELSPFSIVTADLSTEAVYVGMIMRGRGVLTSWCALKCLPDKVKMLKKLLS